MWKKEVEGKTPRERRGKKKLYVFLSRRKKATCFFLWGPGGHLLFPLGSSC
jgi:hypothetical protein